MEKKEKNDKNITYTFFAWHTVSLSVNLYTQKKDFDSI